MVYYVDECVCDVIQFPSFYIVEDGKDVIHIELNHYISRIEKHKTGRKVGDKVMIGILQ